MGIKRFTSIGIGVLLAASGPAWAVHFSGINVFGDSLSDVGNIYTLTSQVSWLTGVVVPDAPYAGGRFSNGPVWVEHVGSALGLDASTPSRRGGTNYAHGGANTDTANQNLQDALGIFSWLGNWGVLRQVVEYAQVNPQAPSDRLNVVWAGGNDFLDGRTDAWQSAVNTAIDIAMLHEYGNGRHFLVPNLPPLGETPRYLQSSLAERTQMNRLVTDYNTYLSLLLDMLQGYWSDMSLYRVDVYNLFTQMQQNPAAYGFDNATSPAYNESTGSIVPDPNRYVFWDDLHPTAHAHEWLAIAAVNALPADSLSGGLTSLDFAATVPEPAALLLLAVGTGICLGRRRLQRHLA